MYKLKFLLLSFAFLSGASLKKNNIIESLDLLSSPDLSYVFEEHPMPVYCELTPEYVSVYENAVVSFMYKLNFTCRYPLQGWNKIITETCFFPPIAFEISASHNRKKEAIYNVLLNAPLSKALDAFEKLPCGIPIPERKYIIDSFFAMLFSTLSGIRAVVNDDVMFNLLGKELFPGGVIMSNGKLANTYYDYMKQKRFSLCNFFSISHADEIILNNPELGISASLFSELSRSFYSIKHYDNRFEKTYIFVKSNSISIGFDADYPGAKDLYMQLYVFANTMQSDVEEFEIKPQINNFAVMHGDNRDERSILNTIMTINNFNWRDTLNKIKYPNSSMYFNLRVAFKENRYPDLKVVTYGDAIYHIAKKADPMRSPDFKKIFTFLARFSKKGQIRGKLVMKHEIAQNDEEYVQDLLSEINHFVRDSLDSDLGLKSIVAADNARNEDDDDKNMFF